MVHRNERKISFTLVVTICHYGSINTLSFPHRTFAHIFALKKQDMSDFSFTPPTSVVPIPGTNKAAAFIQKTSEVKEEHNIAPVIINDKMKYIPWGGDNSMPYNIIDLIDRRRQIP